MVLNQKVLLIVVVVVLAVSLVANVFLVYSNIQAQSQFDDLSNSYDGVIVERDALKAEVSSLVTERDATKAELEVLGGDYTAVVAERDVLSAEKDALTVERAALTTERDSLKTTVATLVNERDTARTNEVVLQGQVNQLNVDVAAIANERDALKSEVSTLIVERDVARAEADKDRARLRLVNHQDSNDGRRITISGYCVNTGIESISNITFHVRGYDMTSNLVVDLYVMNMTVYSGYSTQYYHVVDYAPLVLSSYSVDLVWGEHHDDAQ